MNAKQRIEDLTKVITTKDEEIQQVKQYVYNFEEENKRRENEMIDLNLQRDEALKQLEVLSETTKSSERLSKDNKITQQEAVKNLEQQNDKKEMEINNLKQKLTQQEMKSIKNESVLRDELELVKDKNNKLLKVEATLEIYKSRLAEIPELKAKLK